MNHFSKTYIKEKSKLILLDTLHFLKTKKTKNTFTFQKKNIEYLDHPYNHTKYNERSVEVPLVWSFLKNKKTKRILELGHVLSHYYPYFSHTIVDKYEIDKQVINEDMLTYIPRKKFDVIVSISTIEHIGWDEPKKEKMKIPKVLAHLYDLLTPGGECFCTFPIGYNKYLDEHFMKGNLPFSKITLLKRVSLGNEWREIAREEVKDIKYGAPFPNSNVIGVGIMKKPLRAKQPRDKVNTKRKRN